MYIKIPESSIKRGHHGTWGAQTQLHKQDLLARRTCLSIKVHLHQYSIATYRRLRRPQTRMANQSCGTRPHKNGLSYIIGVWQGYFTASRGSIHLFVLYLPYPVSLGLHDSTKRRSKTGTNRSRTFGNKKQWRWAQDKTVAPPPERAKPWREIQISQDAPAGRHMPLLNCCPKLFTITIQFIS